jgi:hypothetical protein
MKTLVILFSVFYLSSCGLASKFDMTAGSMSCNVNGQAWNASQTTAMNLLGAVTITAATNESGTILLTIPAKGLTNGMVIKLGMTEIGESLDLASSLTNFSKKDTNGNDLMFAASEGEVKITSYSKSEISGTFKFTGTNLTGSEPEVKITSGKFSAKILF